MAYVARHITNHITVIKPSPHIALVMPGMTAWLKVMVFQGILWFVCHWFTVRSFELSPVGHK